jgi:hypothetical protein
VGRSARKAPTLFSLKSILAFFISILFVAREISLNHSPQLRRRRVDFEENVEKTRRFCVGGGASGGLQVGALALL